MSFLVGRENPKRVDVMDLRTRTSEVDTNIDPKMFGRMPMGEDRKPEEEVRADDAPGTGEPVESGKEDAAEAGQAGTQDAAEEKASLAPNEAAGEDEKEKAVTYTRRGKKAAKSPKKG